MGGPGILIGVYSLGTKLCLVLLLKPVRLGWFCSYLRTLQVARPPAC